MKNTYGIKRVADGLWFRGFGPAPDFKVRWISEGGAYAFATRDEADQQLYLLKRFGEPAATKEIPA